MVVISPANPDGIALSAPNDLQVKYAQGEHFTGQVGSISALFSHAVNIHATPTPERSRNVSGSATSSKRRVRGSSTPNDVRTCVSKYNTRPCASTKLRIQCASASLGAPSTGDQRSPFGSYT